MGNNAIDTRLMPLVGHWTPEIVYGEDGSMWATRHISGLFAELAGIEHIRALKGLDDTTLLGINDGRIQIWDHFTRQDKQEMPNLPPSGVWFADRYDTAYRHAYNGSLFRNDLFVTIVMRPTYGLNKILADFFHATKSMVTRNQAPELIDRDVREFQLFLKTFDQSLARYGCRPLSVRYEGDYVFSEVAETAHLCMNGFLAKVPLRGDQLGRAVVPQRPDFGSDSFSIARPDRPHVGSIISFQTYPERTRPTMLQSIKNLDFPLVITSAAQCQQHSEVIKKIRAKRGWMKSSNDESKSQQEQMEGDQDDLRSMRTTFVSHHFTIAIYAEDQDTLDNRVAKVLRMLRDVGITGVRETFGLIPAFWSQMPGNREWATRPEPVKTINSVSFGARHDVPKGREKGRWGHPAMVLKTTAGTVYNYHFHAPDVSPGLSAEDMGSTIVIGPPTSGKTVILGAMIIGTLRNPRARIVVLDKDFGLAVLVRALGGSYLAPSPSQEKRFAPLRALTDSPDDMQFLSTLIKGLIHSDGGPRIDSDEQEELTRALRQQMRKPSDRRSLIAISVMLGDKSATAAGARLRRWCRGYEFGWVFDNDRDDVDQTGRLSGYETGELFKNETICAPVLGYMFYRTLKLINGDPLLLVCDETWQAERIEAFREMLQNLLKTIRKLEGVVVLGTQEVNDIVNSVNASTYCQVPNKIMTADPGADVEQLVDKLKFTYAQAEAVPKKLPALRRTFLIQRHGESVLCSLDLSPMMEFVSVISSRKSTYDLAERLIVKYGEQPQDWVPHFERIAPMIAADPSTIEQFQLEGAL